MLTDTLTPASDVFDDEDEDLDLETATHREMEVLAYCKSLASQAADLLRSVGRDVDAMRFEALS